MRRRPEADESEPKRKARVRNLQGKEMAPPGWGWAGPKVGFAHAPIQEQGKLAMLPFRCHAISSSDATESPAVSSGAKCVLMQPARGRLAAGRSFPRWVSFCQGEQFLVYRPRRCANVASPP